MDAESRLPIPSLFTSMLSIYHAFRTFDDLLVAWHGNFLISDTHVYSAEGARDSSEKEGGTHCSFHS